LRHKAVDAHSSTNPRSRFRPLSATIRPRRAAGRRRGKRSVVLGAANFGTITTAGDPRVIQIAVKLQV
jgi:hypothetical protein